MQLARAFSERTKKIQLAHDFRGLTDKTRAFSELTNGAARDFVRQEVAAARVGWKDLKLGARDRFGDPALAGGRVKARVAAKHQGGQAQGFDHALPVLDDVVGDQIRRMGPGKFQVLARDLQQLGLSVWPYI